MIINTKKKSRLVNKSVPYLFISPWIIGFIVFTMGPLIFSLVMSFFDWPVTRGPSFVGLQNYINMFTNDSQFYKSLLITFKFGAIFVPLNLILALFLALLISQPVKGDKFFRTIFYLPAVVSGVAISIIWGWIFNSEYGIMNHLLSLLGIDGPKWLIDPKWAIVTIVIASAWGLGTMMLIFYTDIKGIPKELYEAASIDGASPLRQFFSITIPIITPTILFNLITSTIGALQQLTLVLLLTGGGPLKSTHFYGLYVYNNAFKHHKLGYASANAWFMFIIILILTSLMFKSSSAWVYYEKEVKSKKKKELESKMKTSRKHNFIVYTLLIIFSFYFMFPFAWMILTAIKTNSEAFTYPPKIFPEVVQLRNFIDAWKSQPFGSYLKNSLIITISTTIGQLVSCSLVAFGFARYDFKYKSLLFVLLLSTMMIPWDVTMIPLYMQFNLFGWINTLKPLIVPAFFGSAYYIFLLRQFLINIPKDLEDAARIDGANEFQIYYKIFLPIMKAPLILIAVLNILVVWNDYLGPLIFLQDRSKYTMALGLAAFKGVHNTQIIPIMAMTIIMIIPPVVAFAFAQKYIVEGISGAIK